MRKFLKVCFWIFWIIMLLVFHIGIYAGIEDGKSSSITIGIIFVLLWWGLTLGVSKIKSKINDNKKQNYNKQNVSNIEINDERFGKIIIKHDSLKHQYDGVIKNVNFDGKLMDASLSSDDTVNIEKIIENLKTFCDKAVLMKNRIYPELTDCLKDSDNFDGEGNLIEITEVFLREKFEFGFFHLYDEETVELWGSWEDSGSQDYSIKYNINKDDFEYELL